MSVYILIGLILWTLIARHELKFWIANWDEFEKEAVERDATLNVFGCIPPPLRIVVYIIVVILSPIIFISCIPSHFRMIRTKIKLWYYVRLVAKREALLESINKEIEELGAMILTVVVKEPNKDAEIRNVITEDVLATIQGLVNGYVESTGIGPGINILCNEDGLEMELPDNCGFVGTIVFVQDHFISEEEGYDWGSLDEENQRKALAWCRKYIHVKHPDKSGAFHMITGEKAIAEHHERLSQDVEARLMDWKSL